MSVKVENLVKVYGQQRALNGISFECSPGSVLGFLGPNGAGKSTTMKILTGFIPATSGSAFVNGLDVNANSMEIRRRIGYLPEHNPLYTDLYVREALGFIAALHKLENPGRRISEVIEATGLGDESRKKVGSLSKGYRQRVGLAQAILPDPDVLILDEPTSGLDPVQVVGIRSLIVEMAKTKTVLLSTHIMQEVEAICENIVIINKGDIVAKDTVKGLKETFGSLSLEEIFISLTKKPI